MPENVFTYKDPGGKVRLPGGAGGRSKKFHSKSNFDKAKKELEATGRLNMDYFNNTQDVGLFLDWYNNAIKERARIKGEEEITEISKFLAKVITGGKKVFFLDKYRNN